MRRFNREQFNSKQFNSRQDRVSHRLHSLRRMALHLLPACLTVIIVLFTFQDFSPQAFAAVRETGPGEQGKTEAELAGYSEERWAQLCDNTLEYDEIEDLVRNFNPSVSNSWSQYDETASDNEQVITELKSQQRNVHDDAQDAKKNGDLAAATVNNLQDKILTSVINSLGTANEKMRRANASGAKEIRSAQRTTAQAARTLMISCCTTEKNLETLQEIVNLRQDLYDAASVRQSAGSGTAADTLTAQSELHSAQSDLDTLKNSWESLKQQLIVLCGWKSTDDPEIADIAIDENELLSRAEALDLSQDTEIAIAKNYDRADYLAESHDQGTAAMDARNAREEEINQNIRINMSSAYSAVQEAKEEYSAAKASMEHAEAEKKSADAKNSAGMLSKADYTSAMVNYRNAEVTLECAKISFFSALEDYDWYKSGNCSIEQESEA